MIQDSRFKNKGAATIELLIALAVGVIFITGAALVSFGAQTAGLDTSLTKRGLDIGSNGINDRVAAVSVGWNSSLDTSSGINPEDGVYATLSVITDISDCRKDIPADSSWTSEGNRNFISKFVTSAANFDIARALGGDCDPLPPSGTWEAPKFYVNDEVMPPGTEPTDLDVFKNTKGKFALMTSRPTGAPQTLWLVDVTDPNNPLIQWGEPGFPLAAYNTLDNKELFSVDVIVEGDLAYAFVGSASSTAQFQVYKVNFSNYPSVPPVITLVAWRALPEASTGEGRSIYFYDDKVYLGTQYLPCPPACVPSVNNEFHIFNVTNRENPHWEASMDIDHKINDIEVVGDWAYLATSDNDNELMVIALNPSHPHYWEHPDITHFSFNASGDFDGTSVKVIGNRAYLGRVQGGSGSCTAGSFLVLDTGNPEVPTLFPGAGPINLGLNPGRQVVGLEVKGELAFIATSDNNPAHGPCGDGGPFLVYNIADPTNVALVSTCAFNFSEVSTGLDFLENTAYQTNSANDALRIIYPSPVCGH